VESAKEDKMARLRLLRVSVAVVLLMLLGACGSGGSTAPKARGITHLTVGVPVIYEGLSSLALAQEFGEFKAENLDVKVVVAPTPNIPTLLASGKIDVAFASWPPGLFNAIASGLELVGVGPVFAQSRPEDGVYVASKFADCEPGCLKGKKLGIAGGYGVYATLTVQRWLEAAGMKLTDITPVVVASTSDALTALEQGAVSVAWLSPPAATAAVKKGTAIHAEGFEPDSLTAEWFVGPGLVDNNSEAIEAFLRATTRAEGKYLAPGYHDDAKVVNAIASFMKVKPEDVIAGSEFRFDPSAQANRDEIMELQETWIDLGGFLNYSKPLPTERLVTDKFRPKS